MGKLFYYFNKYSFIWYTGFYNKYRKYYYIPFFNLKCWEKLSEHPINRIDKNYLNEIKKVLAGYKREEICLIK